MKELSIEEKARRYDEAVERARQLCAYPTTEPFISDLQDLFPELAESEDERIRKEITEIVMQPTWKTEKEFHRRKELCVWLEKQGEQKPVLEMKSAEESLGIDSDTYTKIVDECIFGEQKPAWSEEDDSKRNAIIQFIEDNYLSYSKNKEPIEWLDWLKSLRPQNTWKPSDEQMKALTFACIKNAGIDKSSIKALYELKEQLKQL